MSVSSVLSTAISGLASSSARVAASAQNIVNVNTDGYLAKDAQGRVAAPLLASRAYGAGSVQVEAIEPSNVNVAKEFIDIIAAKAAYEANAKVIRTTEDMQKDVLDIKA
ncbi:MAG: hypothetical protein HQ513_13665 [Rhodospirillales bacterium]|nr:hypothetical protein [Rhodospirillales bacterium]